MKVHPIFYTSLLNHITQDPLLGQRQEPREPVIAKDS